MPHLPIYTFLLWFDIFRRWNALLPNTFLWKKRGRHAPARQQVPSPRPHFSIDIALACLKQNVRMPSSGSGPFIPHLFYKQTAHGIFLFSADAPIVISRCAFPDLPRQSVFFVKSPSALLTHKAARNHFGSSMEIPMQVPSDTEKSPCALQQDLIGKTTTSNSSKTNI